MSNQNEVKVTKMSIAVAVMAAIVADETIAEKDRRKTFIARLQEAVPAQIEGEVATDQLAKSYYQMLKYERDGKGSKYKHHKARAKKAEVADVTPAAAETQATGEEAAA